MNLRHLGLAIALLAGCDRSCPTSPDTSAPTVARTSLDKRTPLPLTEMMATHQKQEMRDHLQVVQEISLALGTDDFDAVAASAARIAWSDKQAMMCKHMGAGAAGFTEMGEHFHRTADRIVEAAHQRDHAAVVTALGATLETCVGCHATYRQEIVDEQTFAKIGGPMDHTKMHGL